MRRLLTPRHVLASIGAGLAVFILFTSVIGMAVAQDDSPQEAPATFVTVRPMFGDEVQYTLSGIRLAEPTEEEHDHECYEEDIINGGSTYCEPAGPPPEPTLQPFGPTDYAFARTGEIASARDAAGTVHDVELIEWDRDGDDQFGTTAHILGTAVPVGLHDTFVERESATWSSSLEPVVQSEAYSVDYAYAYFQSAEPVPPCILRHAFQEAPVVIVDRVEAFSECRLAGTDLHWNGAPMDVVGVETENGVATLHLHGVTEELELDIWLEPQVPYPVRVLTTIGEEHVLMELSNYMAGADDALAFIDTPRDALPELKDAGRQPTGLSFEGIDHPFPPAEAYQVAYDDPLDTSFKEWADANPGHTILASHFNSYYYGVESDVAPEMWWRIELGTENARGDLDITRRVVQGPAGDPVFVDEIRFDGWSSTADEFAMPSTYPAIRDLADRWQAYLPAGVEVHPTMYFFDERHDAWELRAEVFEEDSTVPLATGIAGKTSYHHEDGWAVFDSQGRLLVMDYHHETTEYGSQTIIDEEDVPAPNPEASQESAAPTTLEARPEGPWVPPTPVQAAGAAGVAVATGFLVYLWPALKSLPMFGLFSRLRRPELLGHPSRKKILDVIEADPGIHFQGLHRRTGLSNGNLVHHLRKLDQAGLVSEARSGGYTCYFAARDANRHTMQAAPVLRSDAARTMMDTIQEHPGVNARQLADALGIGSSTVHYHLKRLQSVGLTRAERDGRTMTFFATDAARQTVGAA